MPTLYSTKAVAIGGRAGTVRSEDGILSLQLALPRELGGKGGATNPEQLFAAGYAACFENAVIHHARNLATKVRDDDIEVTATVGLSPMRAAASPCPSRWTWSSRGWIRRRRRPSFRRLTPSAPIPTPSRAMWTWPSR